MSEYFLNKIETRSFDKDGIPQYIVKGYATTVGNIYPYKVSKDKTFREFFSEKAIKSINRKIKNQKVFVDIEHQIGAKESSKLILENIKKKAGVDFAEEIDYIDKKFKYSEIPMFKIKEVKVDDNGFFVEISGNPYYRNLSEEHKNYFDSVWGSLENKFINGMSLNMKTTETIQLEGGVTQIDDVDIYGISLTGSASNDMASITEVAMRSMEIERGVEWQKKRKIQMSSLMM